MRRLTTAALVVCLTATAQQSMAWYDAGHKIVASIAFRQLTPEQQSKIAAILKQHPRFQEDFQAKMPDELTTEAEKNEWIFQQAAIWPDLARSFTGDALKEYHHATWHYFTLPLFLTEQDKAALESGMSFNTSMDPPAEAQSDMNIVQTIRLSRREAADPSVPDAQKAVMLCWLLHTVGDIHQPLHSTSMFSRNLFPTGDRGASLFKTEQHKNLHFVWDSFPGERYSFRDARNRSIKMINDVELSKFGTEATGNLGETAWLQESRQLALALAYDSEVLGYIRRYADQTEAPPLQLSERYLKEGGAAAERRVAEGGYRLGAVLRQVIGDSTAEASGSAAPAANPVDAR